MDVILTMLASHIAGFALDKLDAKSVQQLTRNLAALGGKEPALTLEGEALTLLDPTVDFFQLLGALNRLYTGKNTNLTLDLPTSVALPGPECSWLHIRSGRGNITILPSGMTCPEPSARPPRRCSSSFPSAHYHMTPELATYFARRIWGHQELREGQYAIIERIFSRRNCLGIMPTGAGKSLCFQLAAQLLPGVTLVVSPLVSLMRDQYTNLVQDGISGVEYIDSAKTGQEKRLIFNQLHNGQLKLLYISPERLQIDSFQQELKRAMQTCPVSLLTIDEAHCISEWGHDFRPAYLRLRHFATTIGSPPICALTATASQTVREDIIRLLGLSDEDVITPQTLDRPEISFQVLTIDGDSRQAVAEALEEQIPSILQKPDLAAVHKQGAGVVFAPYANPQGENTRAFGTVSIAEYLTEKQLTCRIYHSRLGDETRRRVQDDFKSDKFPLLVSTKGYGMGIDKANIDYIIHACAPPSLEAYYQEAGRAGRDREHAHSLIITRPRLQKCIDQSSHTPDELLPSCHNGWRCTITGAPKCDYGIQAGMLANDYPANAEISQRFQEYLKNLEQYAQGEAEFTYLSPARRSAEDLRYLHHLHELGAVADFRVLEYRHAGKKQFNLLLAVALSSPESLHNHWFLTNKVVERIRLHKQQKLNMLDSVHAYIKTSSCRRSFLMDYFGDPVGYTRCNFCDIDGIDLSSARSDAMLSRTQLLESLEQMLKENDPQVIPRCLEAIPADQEASVRIRAMRILEEQPDNTVAALLAGLYSLGEEQLLASGLRYLWQGLEAVSPQETLTEAVLTEAVHRSPAAAERLICRRANRLPPSVLRRLAGCLQPPARYTDLHLIVGVGQLEQVSAMIKREVG
ncbi:MAG: RecQ family ATP-dependent DNA helicase [Firmicutes bacterium]|nr:RecQ family ATP-dependent DNA helicase [Bacillota bacterium]